MYNIIGSYLQTSQQGVLSSGYDAAMNSTAVATSSTSCLLLIKSHPPLQVWLIDK